MSSVLLGQPDYPIRFKNSSGGSIAAYGIFKCEGGARDSTTNELIPTAGLSTATGEEALFVNSGLATADNDYGWCRPIQRSPFWVRYNPSSAPSNGDVVGPVSNQTYVDSTGSGIVVIYKDSEKGLVLCDILGGSVATTDDGGFPPGTGGCDCNDCIEGTTIPDATECCKSHLTWELYNPWLTCPTTPLTLTYEPDDKWITEAFTSSENANEYRYQVTVDVDGRSYLTLVLETDNGGDDVCLRFGREGFRCQCVNRLTREEPYGTFSGISAENLTCGVCIKPKLQNAAADRIPCDLCSPTGEIPSLFKISLGSLSNGSNAGIACDDCADLEGDHYVISQDAPFPRFTRGGSDSAKGEVGTLSGCSAFPDIVLWAELYCTNQSIKVDFITAYPTDTMQFSAGMIAEYAISCGGDFDREAFVGGEEITLTCSNCAFINGTGGWCVFPDTITVKAIDTFGPPTSTGACDDDCTPTPAPPNPDGYCCYDTLCLDYVDESFCNDLGGDWNADGDCDSSPCGGGTVCCLPGGACIVTPSSSCASIGGTSLALGATCDDCNGACCKAATETCVITDASGCEDAGDHWFGNGSDCTGKDCQLVACCYPVVGTTCAVNGDCHCVDNIFSTVCDGFGGSEQDLGNDCGSIVCNCNGGSHVCRIP